MEIIAKIVGFFWVTLFLVGFPLYVIQQIISALDITWPTRRKSS
jgi:uncharacterized membrane protein required for colicin V production